MRKVGMLTGGGDCPGLNAVIRTVVEKCALEDVEVFGFYDGWRGVIEGDGKWLTHEDVDSIQTLGGTILGTSRTNVLKMADGVDRVKASMDKLGLECIIAIGGDDTLGVANELQKRGLNMVGVPKTIDNDLNNTDYTFGFDSAANIAMRALDDLKHTAYSHRRVLVVEMMGRYTGWITIQAGIAGNADVVIIPEFPIK
jgi:ATP-dependent phosphofructokinase / diphosphate-dependent phosphofructokinase